MSLKQTKVEYSINGGLVFKHNITSCVLTLRGMGIDQMDIEIAGAVCPFTYGSTVWVGVRTTTYDTQTGEILNRKIKEPLWQGRVNSCLYHEDAGSVGWTVTVVGLQWLCDQVPMQVPAAPGGQELMASTGYDIGNGLYMGDGLMDARVALALVEESMSRAGHPMAIGGLDIGTAIPPIAGQDMTCLQWFQQVMAWLPHKYVRWDFESALLRNRSETDNMVVGPRVVSISARQRHDLVTPKVRMRWEVDRSLDGLPSEIYGAEQGSGMGELVRTWRVRKVPARPTIPPPVLRAQIDNVLARLNAEYSNAHLEGEVTDYWPEEDMPIELKNEVYLPATLPFSPPVGQAQEVIFDFGNHMRTIRFGASDLMDAEDYRSRMESLIPRRGVVSEEALFPGYFGT